MPRSRNHKLKLLYLRDLLAQESDAEHPMTMADLLAPLAARGISAERKSVYDDLATLADYGLDIVQAPGHGGYYLGTRDFELPELLLLIDAVQSSRFLTAKKSGELIGKLAALAGRHEADRLARQVYVSGRIKAPNEHIYYSVDCLGSALAQGRQVCFLYFEWDAHKVRRLRHNGRQYRVSPLALVWDDENYYLVAYDDEAGAIKHYRVDKVLSLEITEQPLTDCPAVRNFDPAAYETKTFGMFGGREELVTLSCEERFAGAVIDRFGRDVTFFGQEDGRFSVNVRVAVSPPFLTWLMNFGGGIRIAAPDWVREEQRRLAAEVVNDPAGAPQKGTE